VHGGRTLEAQKHSSEQILKITYLEDIGHAIGIIKGAKTRGRKPLGYQKLNLNMRENIETLLSKLKKVD
jgi:uncharacterized protein YebE (UPF0316 family)